MKSILALDLGTDTGYAFGETRPDAGTWHLGSRKEITDWGKLRFTRRCDPRVTRFYRKILSIYPAPDIVVFEDVEFSKYTYQTQLWGSFRGALWCAFGRPNVIVECVPVGTLKKFATGHGGAKKEMMATSLFKLYPQWKSAKLSDDAIDALWLWYWAETHLSQA
jgi:Holliday junction resolvasome RuvABC endonuclease subunit